MPDYPLFIRDLPNQIKQFYFRNDGIDNIVGVYTTQTDGNDTKEIDFANGLTDVWQWKINTHSPHPDFPRSWQLVEQQVDMDAEFVDDEKQREEWFEEHGQEELSVDEQNMRDWNPVEDGA